MEREPRRAGGGNNRVNQMIVVRLLQSQGHRATVARNGREAVERLSGAMFDVVLMDMQMPEMDGLEATREIRRSERERGSHVPIIAMTANALTGDREQCLEAGMDGYVSKPLNPRKLQEEIGTVLLRLSGAVEEVASVLYADARVGKCSLIGDLSCGSGYGG